MACNQETLILLSRYANDEATPEEQARASAHLQGCAGCRDLVEDWRGQRQLFVWANTLKLPELSPTTLREVAERENPMSVPQRTSRRITWPRFRINRAFASASMAAVVTVGLVYIYAARNSLTTPRLAAGATIFHTAQTVRVYNGATLEVASNTRLTRLGENRVRLDAGWLRARVRRGGGLRISTSRLDVRDIGTVFQMNAGAAQDSVLVEEGEVSAVCSGKAYSVGGEHILLASAKGDVELARFPRYNPAEDDPGTPLVNNTQAFTPETADGLDWDEGLARLAARFPDARTCGTSGGNIRWPLPNDDKGVRFYNALAQGVRKGLRAHMAEIAAVQAGALAGPEGWSFPVAYLVVDNVSEPAGLPADAYQVDMLSTGGRLFWRFRGSRGADVETPLRFEGPSAFRVGCDGSSTSSSLTSRHFLFENERGAFTSAIQLSDWPGKFKPTISLELLPTPNQDGAGRGMLKEAIRQTADVPNLDIHGNDPTVLCLDAQRSRRMLLAHNKLAGRQMDALVSGGKTIRAGSVLMGVLMTDAAWAMPSLPAGTYLLWWTVTRPGAAPQWAVSPPGTKQMVYLTPDKVKISNTEGGLRSDWSIWFQPSREGRAIPDVTVQTRVCSERSDGFPFEYHASWNRRKATDRDLGTGRFILRRP